MSNYLHNLVARSFGLVETAQPRVTSIFEPPRAFRPVDALQPPTPAAEEPAVFDEDERTRPASSNRVQPAALSDTEDTSGHQAGGPRKHSSSVKPAQADEREPSPETSAIAPQQSGRAPAATLQPFLQRETRALTQQTTPASTQEDTPVVKSGAQTFGQTLRPLEQVRREPLAQEENPTRVSQGKQAEAKARSDESAHGRALPEQRSPIRAQVAEQRTVERSLERALSTERPSPPLLKNESFADLPGLSQKLKVSASDRQQAAQSSDPSETETVSQHRPETLIVQPQVSRYVERQEQGSLEQRRAAEPEQIVQVTIGRIEVRAASPTPAQARAQQKGSHPPSESLEEYLRQRAQGSRNR